MKKLFLFFVITSVFSIITKAQTSSNYSDAIGIRLGSSTGPVIQNGISYKHFLPNNKALEGILSFGNNGTSVCGLYQIHNSLKVTNLQWFYGFGAYIGSNNATTFGGAGIVGLDYKFEQIPLNLSIDWKPEVNIIDPRGNFGFQANAIALSARFVLK